MFSFRSWVTAREHKKQNPQGLTLGVCFWAPGGDLLSRGQSALSSAQSRFTVLFGMGRRGSNSLWPPSKLLGSVVIDRRRSRILGRSGFNNPEEVQLGSNRQHKHLSRLGIHSVLSTTSSVLLFTQGYRIKSHGQLVSVSLTHYCASTPDLSTRWSTATL